MESPEIQDFARRHHLDEAARSELNQLIEHLVEVGLKSATRRTRLETEREGPRQTLLEAPSDALLEKLRVTPATGTLELMAALIESTDRYRDLGELGSGGMGVVRRVFDRELGRTMAMKILRSEHIDSPVSVARFIDEAQVTAQLQHPGVIPVYELGTLSDGRAYFTMQEIRGRNLLQVISEVHAASSLNIWRSSPAGWSFRRLVRVFQRVCETVAYAHENNVIHRDLKPENIMVGQNGEVLLVDWGIARVQDAERISGQIRAVPSNAVITERSAQSARLTHEGAVTGTPSYMAPEQAMGELDKIDARTDIYCLGAILYEILCGHAPYEGTSSLAVLVQVTTTAPRAVTSFDTPPLPATLVKLCEQAMERAPEDRLESARHFADAVSSWLEGLTRRDRAMELVRHAHTHEAEALRLRQQAEESRNEANALLSPVPSWASEDDKAEGWAREDEAAALELQAELEALEAEQILHGALTHAPTLYDAHTALLSSYEHEHRRAELARERANQHRAEAYLRAHAAALPERDPLRVHISEYLKGTGALSLLTSPPGAEVLLYAYERQQRRLVPVFKRSLGRTPLSEIPLAMGRYVLRLRHEGYLDALYPIHIERQRHWDGRPGHRYPAIPVPLLEQGALDANACYVPAGWFAAGGDPDAPGGLSRRRLWVEGFVIQRHPVTNADYLRFLNALAAGGQEERALQLAPRERGGIAGEHGAMLYRFDEGRGFSLATDVDGDRWELDWPVMMVDWHAASAYADWWAATTGQPWRLPGELEWEKAARGADARPFPWGDWLDPSWCCMRYSHPSRVRPLPASVHSYPVDVSPYGVQGMAGNVMDWCADIYTTSGPSELTSSSVVIPRIDPKTAEESVRVMRGGSWSSYGRDCRVAVRHRGSTTYRLNDLGFRLVRSVSSNRS